MFIEGWEPLTKKQVKAAYSLAASVKMRNNKTAQKGAKDLKDVLVTPELPAKMISTP
jgi:hypothetical protein